MSHFLLVYDRDTGNLLRNQRYGDSSSALAARFEAEAEFRGRSEIEIVALGAESEAALRESHARYFLGLPELAARIK